MKSPLTFLVILFFSFTSRATHIPYADMTYRWVSGNDYILTLTVFVECSGVPAASSLSATVCYDASCSYSGSAKILYPTDTVGTNMYLLCGPTSTICDTGTVPGFEKWIYEDTITLTPCIAWTMRFSLCCRNFMITNTESPLTERLSIEINFNNLDFTGNSSPVWDTEPLLYVCCDTLACYDQSATDPDGDSLVYSLYNPYNDMISCTPFTLIPYLPGYAFDNPLTSSSGMSIDPVTGFVTVEPTVCTEVSVMGIQIDEYRDGDLIGTIRRDNMVIVNAGIPPPCPVDTIGVGVESPLVKEFEIFPNPSDGQIHINSSFENYSIQIFSLTGELIFSRVGLNKSEVLDLSNLEKGYYLCRINCSGITMANRLVMR